MNLKKLMKSKVTKSALGLAFGLVGLKKAKLALQAYSTVKEALKNKEK